MSPSERTFLFPNPHRPSYKVTAQLSILTCLAIGGNYFRLRPGLSAHHRAGNETPAKGQADNCRWYIADRYERHISLAGFELPVPVLLDDEEIFREPKVPYPEDI